MTTSTQHLHMPGLAKLPCHANPWQLDYGHSTNQTSSPLPPVPHCQMQRRGLRPATGMRKTVSIVRPRRFRVCLLVFGLMTACIFQVHPGIKSKIKMPQLSPPTNQGSLQLPLLQARVATRSAAKAVTCLDQKAIQGWASKPQLRHHSTRGQSIQQLTESTDGNKLS